MEHFETIKTFLKTCTNAVPNAKTVLEIMESHDNLQNELKGLVFASNIMHFFWNSQRKILNPSEFRTSITQLLDCKKILENSDDIVFEDLSNLLNINEIAQMSLELEQNIALKQITKDICLAGVRKLTQLMRAEELKNLPDNWPMSKFRPTNQFVESTFGCFK